MTSQDHAALDATRLAASCLLVYPDEGLIGQLPRMRAVVAALPTPGGDGLRAFLAHLEATPLTRLQMHYVEVFDMKRKACPYLTYWTDGDTRNRGAAILGFKQAYLDAGMDPGSDELADHLAVVLEFAAKVDRTTGDALLAQYQGPIRLLGDALRKLESPYSHILDSVVATLPDVTRDVRDRMAQIAQSGPPGETVGLEPFPTAPTLLQIGVRR